MTQPTSAPRRAPWLRNCLVLPLALIGAAPLAAAAPPTQASAADFTSELRRQGDRDLLGVYAARNYRPIWLAADGTLDPAARELQQLARSAWIDGVEPGALHLGEVDAALARLSAQPTPAVRAQADLALSRTFADLVVTMRQAPAAAMQYEHSSLAPQAPRRADALWAAASAPSLASYVAAMRWMHPLYVQLRQAALTEAQGERIDPAVAQNLARLRALPALGSGKTILVDAATARLWMYDGDRPVDSMKVVVGKAETQTPMYAGYVRYAILNPYWNVPENLVSGKIAANVLSRGPAYLRAAGYEVLSDWSAEPTKLDPAKIDWREVASGANDLRVRQLPSAANAMGKIKFEFPNPLGIYLHDTPEKQLMLKDQRQFSNGCVRLEDAERLGRWLFQGPLPAVGSAPEQKVDLPAIVPVYITYLTVRPEGTTLAFGPDPYHRDGTAQAFASAQGSTTTLAR